MSYGYDAAGRITSIDSPNNSFDRTFTYDGVGRLKTASGPWGAGSYSYDRLGNIRTRTEGTRTVTINYTSLNRVDQVQDTAQGSGWRSYSHDTRGNVTGDGIHGFTYDFANQPVTVTGRDAGSFAYDGNLKRIKQTIGGKTIYSIYDRSGAILTRDDATANEKTDFITLGGQTLVRVTNGTPGYPLNDHLGSAYMVANSTGGITAANTYNFTPFGEGIGNDPGSQNKQGYTGHIEDQTGLTYMQARYYDPVIGRFLSADPIGFADQLNLYAYSRNDPLNRRDPSGRDSRANHSVRRHVVRSGQFAGEWYVVSPHKGYRITWPNGKPETGIQQTSSTNASSAFNFVVEPIEEGTEDSADTTPKSIDTLGRVVDGNVEAMELILESHDATSTTVAVEQPANEADSSSPDSDAVEESGTEGDEQFIEPVEIKVPAPQLPF